MAQDGLPVGPCPSDSQPLKLSPVVVGSGKSICHGWVALPYQVVSDIKGGFGTGKVETLFSKSVRKKLNCPFQMHLHLPIKRNAGSHIKLHARGETKGQEEDPAARRGTSTPSSIKCAFRRNKGLPPRSRGPPLRNWSMPQIPQDSEDFHETQSEHRNSYG